MPTFPRLLLWLGALLAIAPAALGGDDDVAVAIVCDTSGSMANAVQRAGAGAEPKFRIANRAIDAIVTQLEAFQARSGRKVQAGLFIFDNQSARPAVPLGPLNAAALRAWAAAFNAPNGGTPIGNSVEVATQALWKVRADSRHVLVITDGENTVGRPPEACIPKLQDECLRNGLSVYHHFIAFDVNAAPFAILKKFGSTVLGAGDESQLHRAITTILEEKILLEKE
jgi:hypothetical protein